MKPPIVLWEYGYNTTDFTVKFPGTLNTQQIDEIAEALAECGIDLYARKGWGSFRKRVEEQDEQ